MAHTRMRTSAHAVADVEPGALLARTYMGLAFGVVELLVTETTEPAIIRL
jgi:hypothetical protein